MLKNCECYNAVGCGLDIARTRVQAIFERLIVTWLKDAGTDGNNGAKSCGGGGAGKEFVCSLL